MADHGRSSPASRRGFVRALLRWGGIALAAMAALIGLVIAAVAALDRPSAEPVAIDRTDPAVVAFIDAERALMTHHRLDYTEHTVTVDEPSVHVRVLEVGAGPPVLVLPGGAGDAAYFAPLLAELDGYRFLLVNLPGGGASDGIDLRAHDHRRLALHTLDAIYAHFELDAAPIIGSSRGGGWAWWYALDRPQRVTASVQLGAPGYVEGTKVPPMVAVLGVAGLNRIITATLTPTSPGDAAQNFEQIFGHPPGTVTPPAQDYLFAAQQLPTSQLSWRSGNQADLRAGLGGWHYDVAIGVDDLARLAHPALLIWPANDPVGDTDTGRAVAAALPDAELHVAGTGHLPWLDDAQGIAKLTTDFLCTHEPTHRC